MKAHTINPGSWYKSWSKSKTRKNRKIKFKKFMKLTAILVGILFVAWFIWFQITIKWNLPDIRQIKDITFSQATIITDKNDKVLYKLFSENRSYVDYSGINKNMINAIVSVEDQRYWEHNWVDTMGILRAGITKLLHPASRTQWASTIQQQLVRNILLTRDRNVIRKLKEIVLTKQLNKVLEEEIKEDSNWLSEEEINIKEKEKTLELYLNYIFLWNNAYGVEAAAQTYFGVSAKDLTILQSSILASIPKWPTQYNPYKNRSRLMWEIKITDSNGNDYPFSSGSLQNEILTKIKSIISKADFSSKTDYSSFSKYIKWLLNISVYSDGKKYDIQYVMWRKDFALSRLFEDGHISQQELKEAFLQWLDLKFENNWFPIKAPHFVMRVTELLEEKYDQDTLMKWWLIVKTTLDLDIQEIAEQAINNNKPSLDMYWATNESMVYLDSENGDVLAYVGSIDYFNDDIGWQNDMVKTPRQIWSTMKPFIYSLWFSKLPLTLDTPIYDIPFKIWKDRPHDADGKFLWILPLRNALAYSRNIPAIKMITAVWWQDVALPFLRKIWFKSLDPDGDYWYPLAIWAGEVPMLELADAYSHLSIEHPWEINPILSVRTHEGSLLYEKENKEQEDGIAPGIIYLIRNILSDTANMPPEWVPKFAVRGLKFWLKSGTSNMKTPKWDRARDGRLATYTPKNVAIFRWWNADWSPMYRNAYGWFLNANAMTEFRKTLLANNLVANQWMSAVEVADSTISKISGKLVSEWTPAQFAIKSMWYIENQPTEYDPGMVPLDFDAACNWLASPYTPADQLKHGYIVTPTSFMPGNYDLDEITQRWQWSTNSGLLMEFDPALSGKVKFNYPNMLLAMPQDYCTDRSPQISEDIHISIKNLKDNQKISTRPMVWFNVKSPHNIKRVSISINDRVIWSTEYKWDSSDITDVIISDLGEEYGAWDLTILAVDTEWYSNRKTINVDVVKSDTTAPFILKEYTSVENLWSRYKVILFFNDDLSSVKWWTIKQWSKIIKNFSQNIAEFFVTEPWIIDIVAKDWFDNELKDTIDIRDYIQWYDKSVEQTDIDKTETDSLILNESWSADTIEDNLSGAVG